MKDYFSHDHNSRNDKKLVTAGMKFDLCTAIGAYWCIVEMLYEEGGYLLLSEYDRIKFELRCSNDLIHYLIHDSELFENDGCKFWSDAAIDRLKLRASKSQKARESIENRWNKKRNTNVSASYYETDTIKVKESKVKESKEVSIQSKNEIAFLINEWAKPFFSEKYIGDSSFDTFDKLTRVDGYQPDEIKKAIEWARSDDFWSTNFLSPSKLRNKDKNGVKYIDVFLAKILKNGTNRNIGKTGATTEQLAETFIKHFGAQ